jgi:hypothetical protein
MFLLILDLACVLIVAAWAVHAVRLPSLPARIVAGYLCVTAQIIVLGEILGLIGQLYGRWFLVAHAATAIAVWFLDGRQCFRAAWHAKAMPSADGVIAAARTHPAVGLLFVAVAGAYAVGFLLVLFLPPNNWDSMTYHLSRVGYWLQQRAFYPPWNPVHVIQTIYPVNAELLLLWIVLFTGSDAGTGLIQWSAAVAGMVAIFGTARLWRATRAQAAFAALVWASFPEIMLQSTTTQNDIVAAVFLLVACYFCMLGFLSNHLRALLLSGLAFGLAVGTKVTVLLALPGMVAGALLLWQRRQVAPRRLGVWMTACAAGVCGLALHTFVANLVIYGNPFGPANFLRATSAGADLSAALFIENAAKYLYQAADLTGVYSRIAVPLVSVKAAVGQWLFAAVDLDPNQHRSPMFPPFDFQMPIAMHEDIAWFGPLGILLLLPVLVWQTIQALRRGNEARAVVAAGATSFMIVASAWLRWQPWSGRYFVMGVTLAAPLLSFAYGRHRGGTVYRWSIALIAAMCLAEALISNQMKPLVGPSAIWGRDRVAMQSIQRTQLEPVLRALDRDIPAGVRIGTMVRDDWDYPAFGRHFDRTVVPLPAEAPTRAGLARFDLDYVLLRQDLQLDLSGVLDGRSRSWKGDNMLLVELAPRQP